MFPSRSLGKTGTYAGSQTGPVSTPPVFELPDGLPSPLNIAKRANEGYGTFGFDPPIYRLLL